MPFAIAFTIVLVIKLQVDFFKFGLLLSLFGFASFNFLLKLVSLPSVVLDLYLPDGVFGAHNDNEAEVDRQVESDRHD